ncbi:Mur ligase [Fimicolochytrium jonesii]|uniref:Mur ligase n=1 Tax=Fimicolochytrium jonesii TaxID=1396493 RepID=UPI0022FEEE0D|nr:Mur ligase [Fimicolochytrium jonesii]KAI8818624.1 Mur ligase [Fimicolochytrium jonesii]
MPPSTIVLGLERIHRLLSLLSHPERSYSVVHVGGTNGKGTVTTLIASVLNAAGYITGRFNSPHLAYPHDGVRIKERVVERETYDAAYSRVAEVDARNEVGASLFELQTATALLLFRDGGVEVAVVEVGLGGRLDATNVFDETGGEEGTSIEQKTIDAKEGAGISLRGEPALACVFTAIGLDHTDILGDTIEKIAREKGGIIKHGVGGVVIGSQPEAGGVASTVLAEIANARDVPVQYADDSAVIRLTGEGAKAGGENMVEFSFGGIKVKTHFPLLGTFQLSNLATAIKTLEVLRTMKSASGVVINIKDDHIRSALSNVRWPGRLEWLTIEGREILVDGAHNPQAARELALFVNSQRELRRGRPRVTWIVGFTQGKDFINVLREVLKPGDVLYASEFSKVEGMPWVRCAPSSVLQEAVAKAFPDVDCRAATSRVHECLSLLRDEEAGDIVVVCGSLYLVADLYRHNKLPL